MLTVELRVNGMLVSHLYIRRAKTDGDTSTYSVEAYRPSDGVIWRGEVEHDRELGAEVLVHRALGAVIALREDVPHEVPS